MTWRAKIVPDTEPNADGEWVQCTEKPTYDTILREGWHVVQVTQDFEDRSGESMHQTLMRNLYR